MLNKIVDVLKEVFWIKTPKKRVVKKTKKKAASKKVAKKKIAPKATPKKVAPAKLVKAPKPPKPLKLVKPKVVLDPGLAPVGEVTHYFDRIKVCVVKITNGTVLVGDKVTFANAKSKFVQKVWSMQIESKDVKVAKKGELIGLKVDKPVIVGDIVYK